MISNDPFPATCITLNNICITIDGQFTDPLCLRIEPINNQFSFSREHTVIFPRIHPFHIGKGLLNGHGFQRIKRQLLFCLKKEISIIQLFNILRAERMLNELLSGLLIEEISPVFHHDDSPRILIKDVASLPITSSKLQGILHLDSEALSIT